MSQENPIIPPPVLWAQRKGQVFVTFCLEDCKDPTVKIEPEKIYFKGVGGTDHKEHEVTINLYKEIDPEKVTQKSNGRLYEVVLGKKESGPYWPKLTKENKKFHWLKCDFNKWNDEDDSESDDENSPSLDKKLKEMGYFSGRGDSKPSFDDLDELGDDADNADSDDYELPDLE